MHSKSYGKIKAKVNYLGFLLYMRLRHCAVGKGCHKVVHFLFGADVVGFVENVLLLLFGHFGISIHGRLIDRQCHTEADWYFVEIHKYFSFLSIFLLRKIDIFALRQIRYTASRFDMI